MAIFVDRKEETKLLLQGLKSDESFVILGMRKIGKTVLLEEIERRLGDENICSIRIQSSGEPNFEAVLIKIVKGLRSYYRKRVLFGRAIKLFNDLIKQIKTLRTFRETTRKRKNQHVTGRLTGKLVGNSMWPLQIEGEYLTEYDIEEVEKRLGNIRRDLEDILTLLSRKGITVVLLLDEFGIYGWKSRKNPDNIGHDFSNIRPTIDFYKPLIETWRGSLNVALAASINVLAFSTRGLPATHLELAPFPHVSDDEEQDPSLELISRLSRRRFQEPIEKDMMLKIKDDCHRMPYYIEKFLNEINKARIHRGTIPGLSDLPEVRGRMIKGLIDEDINQIKSSYSEKGITLLEKMAEGIYVDSEELKGTYLHLSHLISRRAGKWEFDDPILREAFSSKKGGR